MRRPDRASGLLVHTSDESLQKTLLMIHGILRVVPVSNGTLMVVFERGCRTEHDSLGLRIKEAVDKMIGSSSTDLPATEWLEEPIIDMGDVHREVWKTLCDVADRVRDKVSGPPTSGKTAVELRLRVQFAQMIQETAGEILSPKKDRS